MFILRLTISLYSLFKVNTFHGCINHDIHRTCRKMFSTFAGIEPGTSRSRAVCLNRSTKELTYDSLVLRPYGRVVLLGYEVRLGDLFGEDNGPIVPYKKHDLIRIIKSNLTEQGRAYWSDWG